MKTYRTRNVTDPTLLFKFLQLALCGLLLLPIYAFGQDAETEEAAEDEPYILDSFYVPVDEGSRYTRNTTASGTAFAAEIQNLPISLEVITEEFIEDIAAHDLQESLRYSSGVFFEEFEDRSGASDIVRTQGDIGAQYNQGRLFEDRSPSGNIRFDNPFANSMSLRGYAVPNQQRLGFRVGVSVPRFGITLGGNTDAANIARVEVVRGPSSILYGINVLSGVVNIHPKMPSNEFEGRFTSAISSHKGKRVTVEHSGPIIRSKLNYRFVGSYNEQGHWEDFRDTKSNYYAAQLEWFVTRSWRMFIEGQYSKRKAYGFGDQWYSLPAFYADNYETTEHPFEHSYRIGRDLFDDGQQTLLDERLDGIPIETDDGITVVENAFGASRLVRNPNREEGFYERAFADYGPGFRITGGGPLRTEYERNLLIQSFMTPFEGLSIEIGGYYTRTNVRERDVFINSFIDTAGVIHPALPSDPEFARIWHLNPEADPDDPLGLGPGEVYIFPHETQLGSSRAERVFGTYVWYETPTKVETLQLRARALYKWETGWFGDTAATHTIMLGVNDIRDKVDFVENPSADLPARAYAFSGQDTDETIERFSNRLETDPVHFRSIYDVRPIEFHGDETLAHPGRLLDLVNAASPSGAYRSGFRHTDLYSRGYYGVYHGQLFNERLHIIAGVRRDLYQVREREQLVAMDQNAETEDWQGNFTNRRTPILLGYADQDYVWRGDLPDSINQRVQQDIDAFRGRTVNEDGTVTYTRPNGTIEYLFTEPQQFDTKSLGLSYRLIENKGWVDSLNLFYLYSEGVFPNFGDVDGARRPIPAEQTTNNEIGIRFETFDRRFTGSISVYQIERENAVWSWGNAPAPNAWSRWDPNSTTENYKISDLSRGGFYPVAISQGIIPHVYGLSERYLIEAMRIMGVMDLRAPDGTPYEHWEDVPTRMRTSQVISGVDWGAYGVVDRDNYQTAGALIPPPTRSNQGVPYDFQDEIGPNQSTRESLVMVDYHQMMDVHEELLVAGGALNPLDLYKTHGGGEPAFKGSQLFVSPGDTVRVGYAGHVVGPDEPGVDIVVGNPLKLAMDLAVRDKTAMDLPFYYLNRDGNDGAQSASGNAAGALVLYEEQGRGIDANFQFELLEKRNWLIILSGSYQKRKVVGKGFNLAPTYRLDSLNQPVDPATDPYPVPAGLDGKPRNGNRWSTEYDYWVWAVGPEFYDDPTDPTTMRNGALSGIDLSMVPRFSFNIFNRYEFRDNFLEGLSLGAGVNYVSSVQTTIPLGGHNLLENRYPTPRVPSRYFLNLSLGYRNVFRERFEWSIQLNVNNVLDKTSSVRIIDYGYDPVEDANIARITEQYHAPREYRLTFSLGF